jgi:hypothetical protein
MALVGLVGLAVRRRTSRSKGRGFTKCVMLSSTLP